MPVPEQLTEFLIYLEATIDTHSERLELLEQQLARQDRVINHLLERVALQPPGAPAAAP